MKELAKEFEGEFNYLGENTEKNKTLSVRTAKEIERIGNNSGEKIKTISYRLQFIESPTFLESSLSNLVNNLAGGIPKTAQT